MPELGPPVLDADACTGCGNCVKACASMVLELGEPAPGAKRRKAVIERPDWCNACGHCEAICPVGCIVSPMPLGQDAPPPAKTPVVDADAFERLLRERRSIRNYKPDPVPRDTLEHLIRVARHTPTGTNSQNVHWLVLADREKVRELQQRCQRFYGRLFGLVNNPVGRLGVRMVAGSKQHQQLREYLPVVQEAARRMEQGDDRLLYDAPALILVHAESWDSCSSFNCDTALFSASLVAHGLGLGCCFNGFVQQAVENSRPLKRWLGIPRDHRCTMTMGVGWPALRYRQVCERAEPTIRWLD